MYNFVKLGLTYIQGGLKNYRGQKEGALYTEMTDEL